MLSKNLPWGGPLARPEAKDGSAEPPTARYDGQSEFSDSL